MTPIEQAKEALQEVSDTMDRKGGVAPIIRMDTLKKVNAALALLKTMEGEEPVAWMNKAGQVISGSQKNTHKDRWERRGNNKSMNIASEYLTPLSTHTKTITVERTFTLSEVTAYADDLMTAHLDPGRVVDREKDEQGADWIHRARNHVNAKHGVSPDSA